MKHHYCPCFYTHHWTNAYGRLVYYAHVNGKVISRFTAPKGTGYEVDLYAKINTQDHDKHTIETMRYRKIDNDASNVLHRMMAGELEILSQDGKIAWCAFVVSMLTRHPSVLNNAKMMEKYVFDRKTGLVTSNTQAFCQIIHKDKLEYWKNNGAVETVSTMCMQQNIHNLDFCERYVSTLLRMTWWIEDFLNAPCDLLTSDYPVSILPINKNSRRFETINEALSAGEYILSLPLSPRRCFYAFMGGRLSINNHNKMVKFQNLKTLFYAKNFVYARDKSQSYFIQKRWAIFATSSSGLPIEKLFWLNTTYRSPNH